MLSRLITLLNTDDFMFLKSIKLNSRPFESFPTFSNAFYMYGCSKLLTKFRIKILHVLLLFRDFGQGPQNARGPQAGQDQHD